MICTATTVTSRGRGIIGGRRRCAARVVARADSPSRPPSSGAAPARPANQPRRAAAPIPAASTQAPLAPNDAAITQHPVLPKPWDQMGVVERTAYLEAVRAYHGRGVILEFFDLEAGGRSIQALVEPEMVRVWREYSWREDPIEGLVGTPLPHTTTSSSTSASSSFAAPDLLSAGSAAAAAGAADGEEEEEVEVVQLHVLTAERIHVGGELPDFVDVLCADGCPANCLADNLSLKPWTPDASASGEWLQFRSRLEERWQWMQLEERYEKLSAEQAQRERRQLLMQAARQRLETSTATAPNVLLPGSSTEGFGAALQRVDAEADAALLADLAEVSGAVAGPPVGPAPTDVMSAEQMDDLMSSFFADAKNLAPEVLQATTSSPAAAADAASSSAFLPLGLLCAPAVQLLLAAPASASGKGSYASDVDCEAGTSELFTEQAAVGGAPSTRGGAPCLTAPWKDMGVDDRRAYLEAVRDFHGEGVLCERVLRSGRTVLALVDPSMRTHWQAHTWRDSNSSGGRLFTETAQHAPGVRTFLAQWTAEACVLGRCSMPLHIARLEHRDGCPANCLASNLELELQPLPLTLPQGAGGSVSSSGAAAHGTDAVLSNNILPAGSAEATQQHGSAQQALLQLLQRAAAAAVEEAGPCEAAPGAGQLRASKMEARKALRSVYDWLGAERGREFFASLHEEYLAAELEQRLLEERRDALAAAGADMSVWP